MPRALLIPIILFLLPIALYFGAALWMEKQGKSPQVSWIWAAFAGVALAGLVSAMTLSVTGVPAGKRYVAPEIVDGKIVPGQFFDP